MTIDELHKILVEHEKDVIDRLGRIEVKLDNDYKTLHGNGRAGLLEKHSDLEHRVSSLEQAARTQSGITGKVTVGVAWLITTAIAVYNLMTNIRSHQ